MTAGTIMHHSLHSNQLAARNDRLLSTNPVMLVRRCEFGFGSRTKKRHRG